MEIKKADTSQAEPDMTPMIDIVFQLIIFFMLVINFSQTDTAEGIRLPVADQALPVDMPPLHLLTVNVDRTGKVVMAGTTYVPGPTGWQGTQLDKLLSLEEDLAANLMKSASPAQDPEDGLWTHVWIRADKETRFGRIEQIIKLLQAKKFNKFAFRAFQKPPE